MFEFFILCFHFSYVFSTLRGERNWNPNILIQFTVGLVMNGWKGANLGYWLQWRKEIIMGRKGYDALSLKSTSQATLASYLCFTAIGLINQTQAFWHEEST